MIYLIHFEQALGDLDNPHGQARHYLGYTDNLKARLEAHRSGKGSRLMEVVKERGIEWVLVRTWPGDRGIEKQLKRQKNSPRLCPLCNSRVTGRA